MRTVRSLVTLACVSGALLTAAAAPAAAAPAPAARPAAMQAASAAMHFGTYYTREYCIYYGESLTSGPSFDSYSCQPYYYPNDPTQYWALYVW